MSYDPAIYLGCAAHYHCGRPAHSPQLEAVLTQEAGLDGNGRLADADCGPGVLNVRLAHLFGQAVGLDPDAGMLAAGCHAAEEKTVMNIRWVQGLAGPARGRARAVPAGGLWPVLPLDRRTASGRDRLRHAGAWRCAGTDRPHGDGAAPATRPRGAFGSS